MHNTHIQQEQGKSFNNQNTGKNTPNSYYKPTYNWQNVAMACIAVIIGIAFFLHLRSSENSE